MKIPLASSGLRASDIDLVTQVLKSGNLTMGKEVKKFEEMMCGYLKVNHFIMVNSGSSANLLILEALIRPTKSKPILHPGDGVLVPAIAWPTTIWPIIQLGLIPIFVDVSETTLAIDLTKAQELIDESKIHVAAIFPIHPLGLAISPTELNSFVNRNGLVLINDVCESLGSWRENQHAGTSGLAASFSFYFSHHITTMEGGGVATNNSKIADDLRSMRSHGWSRDRYDAQEWQKYVSGNNSKFLFVSTGFNFRPMEIQAAIGSAQILEIDKFIERRRKIATMINECLSGSRLKIIGNEYLKNNKLREAHSWMLIPIYVTGENSENIKNDILEKLREFEIETRPVLTGNFLAQPAIKRIARQEVDHKKFVNAQDITENAFLIGAHHDLTDAQVEYLCSSLKQIVLNI